MREDFPSATAAAVALARGVASLATPPAPDPVAQKLLPSPLGAVLRGLRPIARRAPSVTWGLRLISVGLVDHVALRTAAIDEALTAALDAGVDQVVILGAGLDARAYRLDALREATVLEVDHPATQRFKRARVEGLVPVAREVRFVTVDFERDRLDERLAEEGHDSARPTFWIWEGVVMYLPDAAIRGSLSMMRERSAEGSRLAVTYARDDDPVMASRLASTVLGSFRLLGEPLIGLTTTAAFHGLLAEEGWPVEHDAGAPEWRARYGYGLKMLLTISERLAVASCAP